MQEMLAIIIAAIIRSQSGALVNSSSHPSNAWWRHAPAQYTAALGDGAGRGTVTLFWS